MGSSESKPTETPVVEVPVETAAPAEAEATPAAPAETPVEAPAAPSEAETTPEAPSEAPAAPVEADAAPAADAPAETEVAEKKPPPKCKACCACPETKLVRDKCIIENGAENCEELIAAHLKCMRDMGFNI